MSDILFSSVSRFERIISAVFPSSCVLCASKSHTHLCENCIEQFFNIRQNRCIQCAHILPSAYKAKICTDCLKTPPLFDITITATDYTAPCDSLVHLLKFSSQLALAPLLAKLIFNAAQNYNFEKPDILIAVPLGNRRLIERGFNQSHEIAKTLSRLSNTPLSTDILERVRETPPQALLTQNERKKNVRKAFSVTKKSEVDGLHIGLVDDVLTTGETMNELARILKQAGVRRITNFVFARSIH